MNEPYWADKFGGHLYRPVMSLGLGLQWQMGGGAPVSFKVMSVAIYTASALAVLALFLALIPEWPAAGAAVFFAVHPVHVEAVAVAVNQGELIVGILASLAVLHYIKRRRVGNLRMIDRWTLAGVVLAGCLTRENAAVIPLLLLACEWTILRPAAGVAWWRSRSVLSTHMLLWLSVLASVVLRYRIHGGELRGTFTAEGLAGLSLLGRAQTVLAGAVPEWLALLLWPASLQADYSPREIMPVTGFSVEVLLGAVIIGLILVLAIRTMRRAPAVSLGIWWTIFALGPVSNILVPTGIMVAERTMFLPTIGAMMAIGALLTIGTARSAPAPGQAGRRPKWALVSVVGLVAMLGMSRSRSRHTVWHDSMKLWAQTVIDAPHSYRAWFALGYHMNQFGWHDRAEVFMKEAISLWGYASGQIFTLADIYRHTNRCDEAIPYYQQGLAIEEFAPARAGLVTCMAYVGRYQEGRDAALKGIGTGYYTRVFLVWFRVLDQARREQPPAGTVRFPKGYEHLFTEAISEPGAMKRYPAPP
ncbi:MAG: tetratricopeptide repeat protein [Gemmatimonadales bacterium]|nr:tetratricopeptide repeat protein [Gemmatimonadales bacterium]MDZ4390492.1 tetratricopeptide repeat protein [Gemmatimonadales bacterium]